jgi:hypothetical protein
MANPSKLDKAIDRARGNNGSNDESNAPDAIAPGLSAMLSDATDATIAEITGDADMEFAPQLVTLEEGKMIQGILEGNGPEAEFEHVDPVTKVVTTTMAMTWIVRDPKGGQRASILSTAQLDRKLPPFVGGMVKIVRGKDVKTAKGYRVTDYLVAGPKLKTGPRSWATKPVLDIVPEQAQLPAGSTNGATA